MTLIKHLKNNKGNEGVSKLIWVVIMFVIGAILLGLIYLAFSGQISTWYNEVIDNWFGEEKTEEKYPLFELQNGGKGTLSFEPVQGATDYALYVDNELVNMISAEALAAPQRKINWDVIETIDYETLYDFDSIGYCTVRYSHLNGVDWTEITCNYNEFYINSNVLDESGGNVGYCIYDGSFEWYGQGWSYEKPAFDSYIYWNPDLGDSTATVVSGDTNAASALIAILNQASDIVPDEDALYSINVSNYLTTLGEHTVSIQTLNTGIPTFKSISVDVCTDVVFTYDNGNNQWQSALCDVSTISNGDVRNNYALRSVHMSDNITSIGDSTFSWCADLTFVGLSENLISIGDRAFVNCTKLTLTSLPEGITSIGLSSFQDCTSLALTSLPEGISSIGRWTFEGCTNLALTSLPNNLTSINQGAFENCTNLALTSLPEGITSIEIAGFKNCANLTLLLLPDSLALIKQSAFENCTNLTLTSLPNNLTLIDGSAFRNCTNLALTSLPEGLISIGGFGFHSCKALPYEFTIPSTVTSIGPYAFSAVPHINYNGPTTEYSPWGALSIN